MSLNPIHVARRILEGPVVRPAFLNWKSKQFLSDAGYCTYFGVFDSFASARASLPLSPEFDHAALARSYLEVHCNTVFEYDYPVMWWLERAFRGGARSVLDIGGSVGVHYYGYRKYVDMPRDLTWWVAEVPAMVSIGRDLATKRDGGALRFTEDLTHALSGTDVWTTSGAIQYIEDARPSDLLRRCAVRPRHLLLNKLPLCAGEDFVTTQNLGAGCFSPVHVYNRSRFIGDIEALGYTLCDQWEVNERSLYVPGHPMRSFSGFSGLYFLANEEAAGPAMIAAARETDSAGLRPASGD
jgi:putative methyltransferase (TIGR04325 family)